jgi:hypothetical protein
MTLFLFVFLGLAIGYAIPVGSALLFSMAAGAFAPRQVAHHGCIRPRYLVAYTLLWTLASILAGFVTAAVAGMLPWAACAGLAILLLVVLWSNVEEMKKRQPLMQIIGMSLATVVGVLLGYEIFLRTR